MRPENVEPGSPEAWLRYPEAIDEVTELGLQDALLLGRNVLEWAERIVRSQD